MAESFAAPGQASHDAHPAPERARVSAALLWFGILGGPAAWTMQTLVNLPVASHACFPALEPLPRPVFGAVTGAVFLVSLVALAAAIAALVAARVAWQRTRGEQQEGSGAAQGEQHHRAALDTGEGRTRFMALAGMMTSAVFVLVILAHAATLLFVAPCAG